MLSKETAVPKWFTPWFCFMLYTEFISTIQPWCETPEDFTHHWTKVKLFRGIVHFVFKTVYIVRDKYLSVKKISFVCSALCYIFLFSISRQTSLHLAIEAGHAAVCRLLLEAGASLSISDLNGKTPVDLAPACGHKEIIQLLATDKTSLWWPREHQILLFILYSCHEQRESNNYDTNYQWQRWIRFGLFRATLRAR